LLFEVDMLEEVEDRRIKRREGMGENGEDRNRGEKRGDQGERGRGVQKQKKGRKFDERERI
jgi:hypothetical protein